MLNIYEQKSNIKTILAIVAVLIGAFTVYYTNQLAYELKSREKKFIDLYAKSKHLLAETREQATIEFIFNNINDSTIAVPVILTDENQVPQQSNNLKIPKKIDTVPELRLQFLTEQLEIMKEQYPPIKISEELDGKVLYENYIFYKDSSLLTQLQYYPFVQLGIISSFVILAYFAFSYSRRAEQNKVWVGMAKETAHQLGTPLSSLMGWLDYFKSSDKFKDEMVVGELEKDIQRLETITERFSNIGSAPALNEANVFDVSKSYVDYYRKRVSSKVIFNISNTLEHPICYLNTPLYEWVLENLCKNAIDAMSGSGHIDISFAETPEEILILVKDTGHGMSADQRRKVFNPGFTTKRRGWGLGLTLSKRIIDDYHKGKLIVKESGPNGTTFQIALRKVKK